MLEPLNRTAMPEHLPKDRKLGAAEALTGARGGADRTVILDQKEALAVVNTRSAPPRAGS